MTKNEMSRYSAYADLIISRVGALKAQLGDGGGTAEVIAAGQLCEISGNLAEAAQIYRAAAAEAECAVAVLARLTLVQIKLGQSEEALQTAIRLVSHGNSALETLVGTPLRAKTVLGDALLACGQSDSALKAYEEAHLAEPNDARAGSQLVQMLVERGRLDEARQFAGQVTFEPGRRPLKAFLGLVSDGDDAFPAFRGIRFGDMRADHAV